ncbi:acyltransferase [Leifsonia sp. NCR5]|uniref:acyltransferase family protein n=1 Tax=Leifsonia sp. NCR5 TaxID=1978342 RepID=UPI000A1951E8|nr:acyltransferase [Leifsonia sp. NCR5]
MSSSSRRLTSLDGLRGVAALIVVAHHVSLLYQPFAATYMGGDLPAEGSLAWWFSHSPLKLLTAGPEAVIIFFVLSGFVLSLPVLRPREFDWMAYFPRRLVRIGLPVLCSLVLAAGLALLVPQIPRFGTSSWAASTSVHPLSIERFLVNIDPLMPDVTLNNPLWSIFWEMAFSMALALFVGLAVVLKRFWPLVLALTVASTFLGIDSQAQSFRYLPAFFVGALAAALFPRIQAIGAAISSWRIGHLVWAVVFVASLLLLIGTWLFPALTPIPAMWLAGFQPVAALIIVICCLEWSPLAWLLSVGPLRWAGMVSFSLYLVHVPIILTFYYLFPSLSLPVVGMLAVVTAIAVAAAFYWLIEKRSHTLSKITGAAVARGFAHRGSGETAAAAAPDAQQTPARELASDSRA